MSENQTIKPIKNTMGLSISAIPNAYTLGATQEQQIFNLMNKLNEVIITFNNVITDTIDEYIEGRINELFVDSLYDAETETLELYITHE